MISWFTVDSATPRDCWNHNIALSVRKTSKTYDLPHYDDPHPGLLLHHHCGSAAERQERRHFRGFRRTGQPDGVRSARRGQRAFQSHHLVGCGVHDYLHSIVGVRNPARRTDLRSGRFEVATGQDAACPGAEAGDTTHATEVSVQAANQFCIQRGDSGFESPASPCKAQPYLQSPR